MKTFLTELSGCFVHALVIFATVTLAACAPKVYGPPSSDVQRSADPAGAHVSAQAPESPEVVVVEADTGGEQKAQVNDLERQVAQLRDQVEANRVRSEAAAERSEAATRQSQLAIRALQQELTNVRTRLEVVEAKSEEALQGSASALRTAKEFAASLVAARNEQRAMVEKSIKDFDAIGQRLASIERRIADAEQWHQATERRLAGAEQRLSGVEQQDTTLRQALDQEARSRNSRVDSIETTVRGLQPEISQLKEQLLALQQLQEQTSAQLESGPMLRMLRDLESARRETAVLRGTVEDVQRDQEAARKRVQDYYLDLDARLQALQQKEKARSESEQSSPAIESGAERPSGMEEKLPDTDYESNLDEMPDAKLESGAIDSVSDVATELPDVVPTPDAMLGHAREGNGVTGTSREVR